MLRPGCMHGTFRFSALALSATCRRFTCFFLCCFLAPLGRLQSDVISFSRAHIRDSLPLRRGKASPRVFPLRGTHTRKCFTPIDGQRNLRSGKGWAGSWPNWQLKFSTLFSTEHISRSISYDEARGEAPSGFFRDENDGN
jgi:hypothetical protein